MILIGIRRRYSNTDDWLKNKSFVWIHPKPETKIFPIDELYVLADKSPWDGFAGRKWTEKK